MNAAIETYISCQYRGYVDNVAGSAPMEFDDWLAGSEIPEIVHAREACKGVTQLVCNVSKPNLYYPLWKGL